MKDTLFFRKLKKKPNKILVCRTDRIGDLISSLPIFEVLSNQLEMEVQVLCHRTTLPLLENNPFVDVAHGYQPELETYLIQQLNLSHFDALLVLVNDPVACRLAPQLGRIPVRVGPVSKLGAWAMYNHPALQKRSRSIKNEAEYNLDLLRVFGFEGVHQPQPTLYFQPREKQDFLTRLGLIKPSLIKEGYVVLHPGMSGSALNLPIEAYQHLLDWALQQGWQVVLTGTGESENQQVEQLRSQLPESLASSSLNLVDQLSLRELALLCQHCRLFIGPSTGPTHIAGAVRAPLVSFYPPILVQSEQRWAPFKANSRIFTPKVNCPVKRTCKGESCRDLGCMAEIPLDEVKQACLDQLRPNQGGA